MRSSKGVTRVFGLTTKAPTLILLVVIICIFSGPKQMWATLISENRIDSSLYSGKPVKRINVATACVISRIDGVDLVLCLVQKQYIKPLSLQTLDSEFYLSLVRTRKKCSRIKLCRYRSTTRSFLSQSKMVWIDRNPNSLIGFRHPSLRGSLYRSIQS